MSAIPDVDVFLPLEPEELGAKLLLEMTCQPNYPSSRRAEVALAFAEAWAWLEAQGLIVPVPDQSPGSGWRVLSRRARRFESETEFSDYAVSRMLSARITASENRGKRVDFIHAS